MNRRIIHLSLGMLLLAGAAFAGGVAYFTGDVEAALTRADQEKKLVVLSVGREVCGRCQKFYRLLSDGRLVLDEAKCMYLKLDVDNMEHREYFYSWIEPPDRRLPFVAVLDPNARTGTCVSAGCDLAELQKLLGPLAKPTAGGAKKSACGEMKGQVCK